MPRFCAKLTCLFTGHPLRERIAAAAAVGAPDLRLRFDACHVRRIHGDVPGMWQRCAPLVAPVEIAGAPGRHEREAGGIDDPAFSPPSTRPATRAGSAPTTARAEGPRRGPAGCGARRRV